MIDVLTTDASSADAYAWLSANCPWVTARVKEVPRYTSELNGRTGLSGLQRGTVWRFPDDLQREAILFKLAIGGTA